MFRYSTAETLRGTASLSERSRLNGLGIACPFAGQKHDPEACLGW
jgi:hypothetical protein